MVAWTKPADKWATEKAAEMLIAGYDAGTIIRHLEAYGIGLYAAQALVRPKKEVAGNVSLSSRYPDTMDLGNMLASLRQERDQLTEAIMSLERMSLGQGKRRGRPPAWMVAARQTPTKRRGRPPGSKNTRKNS